MDVLKSRKCASMGSKMTLINNLKPKSNLLVVKDNVWHPYFRWAHEDLINTSIFFFLPFEERILPPLQNFNDTATERNEFKEGEKWKSSNKVTMSQVSLLLHLWLL